MAKPDTWMPLYVGDYLRDTQHLSRSESGAYLHLIMAYWSNGGPLHDDPQSLAAITKSTLEEWEGTLSTGVERSLNARCRKFFQIHNGFWHHKRVDLELEKANRNIEQKKRAGLASAAARVNGRTNSRSTDVAQPLQRNGNTPPPPPPIGFGYGGKGEERGIGWELPTSSDVHKELTRLTSADPDAANQFPQALAGQLCLYIGMNPVCAQLAARRNDITPDKVAREWANVLADETRVDKIATLVSRLRLKVKKNGSKK